MITALGNKLVRALAFALALALVWVPGGGLRASAAPPDENVVETRQPSAARAAPRKATPDEVASYASREAQASPALAQFAGGDRSVLVITGSTLAIILLVVLIVVLI